MYTAAQRKALQRENRSWPEGLVEIPRVEFLARMTGPRPPARVRRSREFLVQMFKEGEHTRLSICRTIHTGHRWADGITWDDLQRLKCEAGFFDVCAVEIYPPDADVVNAANMRHLWLLAEAPPFMWRSM